MINNVSRYFNDIIVLLAKKNNVGEEIVSNIVGVVLMSILVAIGLIVLVFGTVGAYLAYEDGGVKGWTVFIPFCNVWNFFKIAAGSGAKMFFMLIPFYNAVYLIICATRFGKAIGRSGGFGFGIQFMPYFFCPIIGIQAFIWKRKGLDRKAIIEERKRKVALAYNMPYTGATSQPQQRYQVTETVKPQVIKAAYCHNCGNKLGPDDRFCQNCGTVIRNRGLN